jgi:radical SAM protein with 4Fe4S-binding SPASM domain
MALYQSLMDEALRSIREGRTEDGLARLRQATVERPDSLEAWGHLAGHLARAGRHEEALECYRKARPLAPGNLEILWRSADRLVRLGRLDEATAEYRAALDQAPSCHEAAHGLQYVEWLRDQNGQSEPSSGTLGVQAPELVAEIPSSSLPVGLPHNEPPNSTASCSSPTGREGRVAGGEAIKARKADNERRAREHFERKDALLTSMPIRMYLESTTRCNAACIMCYRAHGSQGATDLRPAVFDRIVREVLPDVKGVSLSGAGEPMLAPGFDGFFDEAIRRGVQVSLVTNATLLTVERLDRFARCNTIIGASLDGATAATFESIRRRIRFDRAVENLRFYKRLRDVHPDAGSVLWVNFVAMRRNIEELPAVVDLAADLGAEIVSVMDLALIGGLAEMSGEHLSGSPGLANALFGEARRRAEARDIKLELPLEYSAAGVPPVATWLERLRAVRRLTPEPNRFPRRCPEPWITAFVAASGKVHPCCGSRRVMGDLNEDGFERIWNGRRYRAFRRRIDSMLPPSECRTCTVLYGINFGNASVVRAREGLVVKILYRGEAAVQELLVRLNLFERPK